MDRLANIPCPVCTSHRLSIFWEMHGLPVHCNVLCTTREEALRSPTGDIRLAVCDDCGFIHNVSFDPQCMQYDRTYENSLHFSPRFRDYAHALATRLIEKYELYHKDIIEIACGKGEFLTLLCERGDNRGVGFDPGYVPGVAKDAATTATTFIQDFYSERYSDYRADLICCRHALEHIPYPVAFLQMVRWNIGDRRSTVVFFEVPNVLFILRELGVWDIIYEHCSYFSPQSIACCFAGSGFAVRAVTEAYGGQFLCIEALAAEVSGRETLRDYGDSKQVVDSARVFAECFKGKLQTWRNRLDSIRKAGRRAVVWGSGSKGVTFLNMMKDKAAIEYVVDINPRKEGMYVAGTGQTIISPDALRDYQPDTLIVMNPIYADEINSMTKKLGLDCELHVA